MGKELVLIGGGHAHMMTMAGIADFVGKGHRVTVIGPSDYHYYSGMGPGMLGGTYTPDDIRFATRHLVEKLGGRFVRDRAVGIDAHKRLVQLASGDEIAYDVLYCNAGSHVPRSNVDHIEPEPEPEFESASELAAHGDIFSVKPIERLSVAKARIEELAGAGQVRVGIVGGGPSAAEIAGNLWQLVKAHGGLRPRITILARSTFMGRFPQGVRRKVMAILHGRGIDIRENEAAQKISPGRVRTVSGEDFQFQIIFLAQGVKPASIFAQSGLPVGSDGGLLVNRFLQSSAHPEIFGGGDCIFFEERPLDKVGVYAVRQNPVLLHNLMAALQREALMPFDPGGDYLLIFNLGGGRGVLRKKAFILGGRLAFMVKDYIDRKFMQKFQAYEK
jgi:NADH dehydrogenase FAD-containing subunit